MNPYMPGTEFIPDGEPRIYEYKGEKRLFVYGSRDDTGTYYCGFGHTAWSAPLNDLTNWTNHGEIFNIQQLFDLGVPDLDNQVLAAPDCVYNPKDGKYYMYVFTSYPKDSVTGYKIWVTSSNSPAGPFINPQPCEWPSVNRRNGDFDPAVLIDDDGRVYAYWGFGMPCWAELDSLDMRTVISHTFHAGNSGLPFFFEAPSIRKIENKYVFVYSGRPAATLHYSYSDCPLGPWIYGGPIVSNHGNGMAGGNNHGGIIEINGEWYVNYHRPSPNNFCRQAMMEPINVSVKDGKVIIAQVAMTSQGVEKNGLDAFKRYHAGIICYKEGNINLSRDMTCKDGLHPLTGIKNGATAGFLYMNFGEKYITETDSLKFKVNIRTLTDGVLEIFVSDPAVYPEHNNKIKIGQINFKTNDTWHELSGSMELTENLDFTLAGIDGLRGIRGVFIRFASNSDDVICELKEIEFALGDAPTPNPKYEIELPNTEDGFSIIAVPNRARQGESVLLKPSKIGADMKDLRIIYGNGSIITANKNGDGTLEFKMPNASVIGK